MPFVYPAGGLLNIRRAGVHRLPHCRSALINVGVFPVHAHYYEPQFDYRNANWDVSKDRVLTGIDWNVTGPLEVAFRFSEELSGIPRPQVR